VRAELAAVDPAVEVVGEAEDAQQAVPVISATRPDVVLLDVHLPGGGGRAVLQELVTELPEVKFLALSVSDAAEDVIGVIRAGARGYVTKSITGDELAAAIRRVADGDAVFSPRLAGFVLDAFAATTDVAEVDEDLDRLSQREREVLRLIARGYTYKEVGKALFISVKTVETHVSAVLRKLQLSNRHELTRWAPARRLVWGRKSLWTPTHRFVGGSGVGASRGSWLAAQVGVEAVAQELGQPDRAAGERVGRGAPRGGRRTGADTGVPDRSPAQRGAAGDPLPLVQRAVGTDPADAASLQPPLGAAQDCGVIGQELRRVPVLQRLPGVVDLDVQPPAAARDVRAAHRGGGRAGPGQRVRGDVPAVVERAGRRVRPGPRAGARLGLPERPVRRQPRPRVGGVQVVSRATGGPGPDDLLGQARVDLERAAAVDADDAEVGGGRPRAVARRVGHVVAARPGGERDGGRVGSGRQRQSGQRRQHPDQGGQQGAVSSRAHAVSRGRGVV
jgi:DNA-binding NarL/FixJ family response regulator